MGATIFLRWLAIVLSIALIVLAGWYWVARLDPHEFSPCFDPSGHSQLPAGAPPQVEAVEYLAVSSENAKDINARTPFASTANPPAAPFLFSSSVEDRERALTCLASAVYLEAGDDIIGQQAVVQVVLNRMRQSAFPKTVCAGVLQGAERRTGCRFTFTCDGALARAFVPALWERARQVASPALSGSMVADYDPAHLVVYGLMPHILRWGIRRGIRTIGMFADSFNKAPIKRLIKYVLIHRQLNSSGIDWVGNHGINACLSLVRQGVERSKIIPWDWPHDHEPEAFPAKQLPSDSTMPSLFYVGYISEAKGVGDAVAGVAELKKRGRRVKLRIAGAGQVDQVRKKTRELGVEDDVKLLGLIVNSEILPLMLAATLVLVPSRHEFPEGLPLTIYEAPRSRTPIVASDHPMFAHNLVDRQSARVFLAAQPEKIADCIDELLTDDQLYAALSANSPDSWRRIQIDGKWGDILWHWLRDHPEDRS